MNLVRNMHREAELAVALVNLARPGDARGRAYQPARGDDLATQFSGCLSSAWATRLRAVEDAGARLAGLADALHAVFISDSALQTVALLNDLLQQFRAQPYLTDDVDQPFHLHFHGDHRGTPVEALASELVFALALVVDAYGTDRFGVCVARVCDRVYVDLTRNGSRRYCSDACGARTKMAAHRARRLAAPGT
jgi:predicted RNA-binding Zn ribbon-like protein